MSKLQIRVLSANRQVKLIDLAAASRIPAEKGAVYSVVDQATGKAAEGIVLKKKGSALLVEQGEQIIAEIEQFYVDNQQAAFDVSPAAEGQAAGAQTQLVTATTPATGENNIVWQAADSSTEAAGFGMAGYLLGGALIVGGIAAGSSSGGGNGSSGSASATPAPANNTVSGTVVGGPVVATNDLKVVVYKADGVTVLGEGIVDANGRFTVQIGDYVGVVIAKVVNQGTGADYLDEATGVAKDINAQFFSTGVVTSPNTTLSLNVNALTTVAYQEAKQLAGSAPLDVATVTNANQAIATAFGIADLQATTVVTTNGNTTFNSADGLSAGENYGAVLASLSGADQNNAGNSQTTIDNLVAGITVTTAGVVMTDAVQTEIVNGANTADPSGNLASGVNNSITATVTDTTAPSTPTLGGAGSTNDSTPTLSGTAEAGSTITVVIGGATYTTTAGNNGAWSVDTGTATPTSGSYTPIAGPTNAVVITSTDPAGNSTTANSNIALDTSAPNTPVLGGSGATNDNTPTLNGTAEAGSTITVVIGGATYTTTVGNNGTWSVDTGTATPTSGSYTAITGANNPVVITSTDPAGNSTTANSNIAFDSSAPTANFTAATDDVGGVTGSLNSGDTTDDTALVLSGTCEAGSTVNVYNGTNLLGAATVSTTTWSYTATVANGTTYQFNVKETDLAGNTSAATTDFTVIGDSSTPITPTLGGTGATNDNTPTLSGTAEAGSAITVVIGGATYTTAAGNNGAWSVDTGTATPTSGNYTPIAGPTNAVVITSTDPAGNSTTANSNIALDTSAPNTPALGGSGATNDNTPTLNGTAEAGSTITVVIGGATYTTTAGNNGAWSVDTGTATPTSGNYTPIAGPTNAVAITSTDPAGNSTTANSNIAFDSSAPTANFTAATDDVGGVIGSLNSGDTTDDTALVLSGTCEAGSTVNVYNGTNLLGAATVSTTTWSYTATVANGTTYLFNVKETDLAGNTSAATTDFTVIGDSSAPTASATAAIISNSANASVLSSETGTAYLVKSTITVTDEASITGATANEWNTVAITTANTATDLAATGLVDGSYKVYTVDAAGNLSAASTNTITVDSVPPSISSVTVPADDTYILGETLSFTVNASEAITVVTTGGTPRLELTIGSTTRYADYVSGSGTSALVFSYIVQSTDLDANGITLGAIDPNGGTLRDVASNNLPTVLSGAGSTANINVDGVVPVVTDAKISIAGHTGNLGEYKIGDTVTVTWDNTGSGDNNSDIAGVTADFSAFGGGTAVVASDSGGSWTASYTLVAGSIERGANNVTITVTDTAGNTTTLADTTNADVDNIAPTTTLSAIDISADTGSSDTDFITATASQTITATLSAALDGGQKLYGSVNNGSSWTDVSASVSSTTLTWTSATLSGTSSIKFKVTDAAGNNGTIASQAYSMDTSAPTATINNVIPRVQLEATGNSTGNDYEPRITSLGSSGEYVVVWHGYDEGYDNSIFVQKFTASGATSGALVKLEAEYSGSSKVDNYPEVSAVGSAGEFAVTWFGVEPSSSDNSVYVQQFASDGTTGSYAQVKLEAPGNTYGLDQFPMITAVGTAGDYVVVWRGESSGGESQVFVQKFSADGTTAGHSLVTLDSAPNTTFENYAPKVIAAGTDGSFYVTWSGRESDAIADESVLIQKFDASGAVSGLPIALEMTGVTNKSDSEPSIAMVGNSGEFVVACVSKDSSNNDVITVQKYAANGTPGTQVTLGAGNSYNYEPTVIAVGSAGAYVVMWDGQPASVTSVFMQRFNADGTTNGSTVELSSGYSGYDNWPVITAVGTDGAFVIAWSGQDTDAGHDMSIHVQKFNADGSSNAVVTMEATGYTTGYDDVLRIAAIGTSGAFAVTWTGEDSDSGHDRSIFVQQFDAVGSLVLREKYKSSESVPVISTDVGTAYLVRSDVTVATEADILAAAVDKWNSVSIATANTETSLAATGLLEGTYRLYTVDGAGNLSSQSASTIQIDNTPPTASVNTASLNASGFAVVRSTEVGTAYLVKSTVTVNSLNDIINAASDTWNSVAINTANTDTNLAPTGLVDGTYKVYTVDQAGNLSAASTNSVTVDALAPTVTIDSVVFSADTGSSASDWITKTAAQDISGTYTGNIGAGETLEISLNNGSNWVAASTATGGNWTLTSQTLTSSNTLKVRVVDAAGNSSAVLSQAYTLDSAAPTASVSTASILPAGNAVVQSTETGTAYLVNTSVTVSDEASITGAGDSNFNSAAILSASTNTNLAATGLVDGTYKVYSIDTAGNLSNVSSNSVIVDNTAPVFTSTATASAINENSGSSQVIYTAATTDITAVSYSLKPATGDGALFSINSGSGAVTLTGNPDYETKQSYSFTVVATDAVGKISEQAVSLAINNIADEIAPVVSSVAITSATGAQNNRLNAGDVVSITVTMDEATIVNISGGTPYVSLTIGSTPVQAAYASGSGSTSLVFQYTILATQTDADGISIASNSLNTNGGTLKDSSGNNATLTHSSVANNASYLVDTTAPTLSSSTPVDNATGVAVTSDIVLNFDEAVQAGTGWIVLDDNTAAPNPGANVTDNTQVTISGSTLTYNPTASLNSSTAYDVTMANGVVTDLAGNAFAGIATDARDFTTAAPVDTNIVVFDLVNGNSSSHSSRTFDATKAYTIYIKVSSSIASNAQLALNEQWAGGTNLNANDKIVLVGTGSNVLQQNGSSASSIRQVHLGNQDYWKTAGNLALGRITQAGTWTRQGAPAPANAKLWVGAWAVNPNADEAFADIYKAALPVGVLTSQGLA